MSTALLVPERASWKAHARVDKWDPDQVAWARRRSGLVSPIGPDLAALVKPSEVVEWEGNLLCNAGIARMEDLLIGAGGQAYTNTFARIGVGNGAGTAAATDTDLSAAAGSANRWFQAMLATFPSRSAQTLTFKSSYASADANFTWNEWAIDAGGAGTSTSSAVVGAPLLNHRTSAALGQKAVGAVWDFTGTVLLS